MKISELTWSPSSRELVLCLDVGTARTRGGVPIPSVQAVIDAFEDQADVQVIRSDQLDLIPDNGLGRLQRENAELKAKLDKLATPSPRMAELEKGKEALRLDNAELLTENDELREALGRALRVEQDDAIREASAYLGETDESIIRSAFLDFEAWTDVAVVSLEIGRYLDAKFPKAPTLEQKYEALLGEINEADSVAEGVELMKQFVGGLDGASD